MRYYKSQQNFKSYKPYQNFWKRFFSNIKKKQRKSRAFEEAVGQYHGNPFVEKARQNRFSVKTKILTFTVIVAAWMLLLLYLPPFNINDVGLSGLKNITADEMEGFISSRFFNCNHFLPCRSYFFVKPERISKALMENFSLNFAVVEKVFPNELQIDVEEKIAAIIYDNGKKYFLLDNGGSVAKYLDDVKDDENINKEYRATANSALLVATSSTISTTTVVLTTTTEHIPNYKRIRRSFGTYPILYDKRRLEVVDRQTAVIPEKLVTTLIEWQKTLGESNIAQVSYFEIESIVGGMRIHTDKLWDLFTSVEVGQATQLDNLKLILRDNKPKETIDLRFGERVYWK